MSPLSIMYVEDEEETRELIAAALAQEYPDMTLYTAVDGSEGLKLFREHHPDVVVTDIRMPVMDGLRMGEEIRKIDPSAEMIALTAYSDTTFLMSAIETGFSHYVLKPTEFDKLFAAVGKSLTLVTLRRQVHEQNEQIRRDAAELEQRLQELRDSEQRLAATFNQAAVGIAHIALDGRFLRMNRKFCDIAECVSHDMKFLTVGDHTHPEDRETCLQHHQLLVNGKLPNYSLEKRYVHKDGSIVWVRLTASLVSDAAGDPLFIVTVIDDITRRKRAEEERERLLAQHEAVLNSIHEGVVISDPEGCILAMNRSALLLHGFQTVEETRRKVHLLEAEFELSRLGSGDPVTLEQWPISRALRGERFTDYDLCVRRKDTGKEYIASYSGTPVRSASGDLIMAVVTLRDITERKQAEEALRRSEQRFSTIFHSVPATITMSTLQEATCIDINEAGLQMLGYERHEVIGRSFLELGVYQSPAARVELLRLLEREGKVRDLEVKLRGKGGRELTVLFSAERMEFEKECYLLSIITDITHRKQMEEEVVRLNTDLSARAWDLERANRELEAFDYTVAHDLRKPLTVINGYCQAIRDICGQRQDNECMTYSEQAYEATLRMNRLIDSLLLFSQAANVEPKRERVDLSRTAEEVAQELKLAEPERNVRLVIAGGMEVDGDPNLLRVVLANLLGNAWKYTAGRDEAVIEFGKRAVGGEEAFFVMDNGIGLDPAQASDIFTPFRRLPDRQQIGGLGIGLATVARIIERHGGRVWAEGEPGRGATFYFTV